MEQTIKFKEIYKSKIVPILKEKKELNSKKNELDSKINELDSKILKLDSKRNELYSKINELYSKIDELDSKILKIFSEFDEKHNLVIQWNNYDFELKDIELKYYNKDKTGFIYCNMNGKEREVLFEPEKVKIIDGKRYVLDE